MSTSHKYENKGHKANLADMASVRGGYGGDKKDIDQFPDTFPEDIYGHAEGMVGEDGEIQISNRKEGKGTRMHISGTGAGYIVDPQGNMQQMMNHSVEYCKGGKCSTIEGNLDFKVGGIARVNYDKDYSHEVGGKSQMTVKGTASYVSQGGMTIGSSKGNLALKGENGVTIGGPGASPSLPRITMNKNGDLHFIANKISFEGKSIAFHGKQNVHVASGKNIELGWIDELRFTKERVINTNYPEQYGNYKDHHSTESSIKSS